MSNLKIVDENFMFKKSTIFEISIGGLEHKYIVDKISYTDGSVLMLLTDQEKGERLFYSKYNKDEVESHKDCVYTVEKLFIKDCMTQLIYDRKNKQYELLEKILHNEDEEYINTKIVGDMEEEYKISKEIDNLTIEFVNRFGHIPDKRDTIRKED